MYEPGRNFNSNIDRFGFNGKLKDDEAYGSGNEYDFNDRIYDPRIGRWMSCDPLFNKYPGYSPYNNSLNNPVVIIDKKGADPREDPSSGQGLTLGITDKIGKTQKNHIRISTTDFSSRAREKNSPLLWHRVIGNILRFAGTHELGHALGLRHTGAGGLFGMFRKFLNLMNPSYTSPGGVQDPTKKDVITPHQLNKILRKIRRQMPNGKDIPKMKAVKGTTG